MNCRLICSWILLQVVQTFFLYGPVKSLQMCIVIRSANPAVPMGLLGMLREPLRKLWSVITLQHLENERGLLFRFFQKFQCSSCGDSRGNLRMGPARVHIQKRVDVESLPGEGMDVNGIKLHQIPSLSHIRPVGRSMVFLPFALLLEESFALQDTLHRAEADCCSLLLEEMMNDFTATSVLQAKIDNGLDCLLWKRTGMVCRTRRERRKVCIATVWSPLHPATDCAWLEARVTSHLTDAPPLSNEQDSLHSEAGKMRIGRIWHTSGGYGRCCQAIEPLRTT